MCFNWRLAILAIMSINNEAGFGQQMPATQTQIISRANWGARPSTLVEHFNGPAPYVIIHHSYMPSACYTRADCIKAMRSMQDYHQLQRGWNDIGYSFAIGGDGMIYVGRGFNVIGAHAPKYNDRSVGICMIGDWRTELPPPQMLAAAKSLIEFGMAKGYIDAEYKLLAHRQVRDTECPGQRLYEEITTWPHFALKPQATENDIAK
ncbi:peptidoglycan-recognition protein LB-like isoform X1 [Bactrocera neohumeralis]|uniref:peptidoglycan-recognition protein LB-like isoform X1 n=1 Tax=Bactrocera tryoni TaxID=59916 RepID=UPI001A95AD42|nr:peptidoglycan-recognition protein LB-like isoform X1 [Bactrocera tryoni]XP_050341487.1 peptidoglycan-recognition protein LB-like isoform X1 [Bactrocera neohumeralis]